MTNWQISDEEKLLKQSAEEFFREKLPVSSLRYMRDRNDQVGYSPEIWKEMAELGWTGILIPEEYDGLNFGLRGLGVVLEAAGRTLSPSPLFSTVLLGGTILQAEGSESQKKKYLPAIAGGKLLLAVGTEEGLHHGSQKIEASARREGEGYRLSGQKKLVLDAQSADKLVVLARTGEGERSALSWFIVDRQAPGVTTKTFRLIDGRLGCHLELHNVSVPAENLLGFEGKAAASYQLLQDAGAAGLAAEMLGSATAAFEMTLAYLKERKQFGVAIGSFQALQHRAAHMYCELEVSRAAVQKALSAYDSSDPKRSLYASLAKAKVGQVFEHVARECLQLFAGIGMTDEHVIGFYLKRSRIATELFGNNAFHRDRYASLVGY